MISLAKAAKTSMRRMVRRDKSKRVKAEASKDAEPPKMFARFKRGASKAAKPEIRLLPEAAATSTSTSTSASTTTVTTVTNTPRKAMRTAVNKIKQHVSDTLERLLASLRGAQKNLTTAVANSARLEQQAEQLNVLVDTAGDALATARSQATTAAAAVGVLEHLEQQLARKVQELQSSYDAATDLSEIERTLRLQHQAVVEQKLQVKEWYMNAAQAQAVQSKAAEVVGQAQAVAEDAQRETVAAATALYEAQRAAGAAKEMIMQAVTRAHIDDVREESGLSLEEEQLVLGERGNEVVVVGHVSLAEKLRMEEGEVWQDVPEELQDVYNHLAVMPQREDYEAAKNRAQETTARREMVAQLAEKVASLASAAGRPMSMLTNRDVQLQLAAEMIRREECENRVRYLATRLNWVRAAAMHAAADDIPWISNQKLPEVEVESSPSVIAAIEQLNIAKADLMASDKKIERLNCTAQLQDLFSQVTSKAVQDGESVPQVATELMKGAVVAEIRAYRHVKLAQQALQQACEAVQLGLREGLGAKATPERSLARIGLEPKRLNYFMQFYMENLPKRLSTRPRPTHPAPTPPRKTPSPLSSTPKSDAFFLSPVSLPSPSSSDIGVAPRNMTGLVSSNGALSSSSNGVHTPAPLHELTNGSGLSTNGINPSANGFAPSSNGTSPSRNGLNPNSTNGVTPSELRNGSLSVNGVAFSSGNGSTPSTGSPPSFGTGSNLSLVDSGPDIARVREALRGFLDDPTSLASPSPSESLNFARPGRLGSSRRAMATAHPLAGTSLEVEDRGFGRGAGSRRMGLLNSIDESVELDSALLDSVRTRLALAQLLERADSKVVRELASSQLAADSAELQGGGQDWKEEVDIQVLVQGGPDVVPEAALDRLRAWYALQYMLERAHPAPGGAQTAPPPATANIPVVSAHKQVHPSFSPLVTVATPVASFALDDVDDDDDDDDLAPPSPRSHPSFHPPSPSPLELAQAFTNALMNDSVVREMDHVFTVPPSHITTPAVPTPAPVASLAGALEKASPSGAVVVDDVAQPTTTSSKPVWLNPSEKSRYTITIPKLVFQIPTWEDIARTHQEKAELTGSLLAMTLASWGGIVGYHMDSAAGISALYFVAGLAAVAKVNEESQKTAEDRASVEATTSVHVAEVDVTTVADPVRTVAESAITVVESAPMAAEAAAVIVSVNSEAKVAAESALKAEAESSLRAAAESVAMFVAAQALMKSAESAVPPAVESAVPVAEEVVQTNAELAQDDVGSAVAEQAPLAVSEAEEVASAVISAVSTASVADVSASSEAVPATRSWWGWTVSVLSRTLFGDNASKAESAAPVSLLPLPSDPAPIAEPVTITAESLDMTDSASSSTSNGASIIGPVSNEMVLESTSAAADITSESATTTNGVPHVTVPALAASTVFHSNSVSNDVDLATTWAVGSAAALRFEDVNEVQSTWQWGKAWFTRVAHDYPELTGSVLALGLGTWGYLAATLVHS